MRTTILSALAAALLVAPATAVADPPAATTGAARDITSTGATLTGPVNPRGAPTSYFFEYGRTKNYGTRTVNASAGSGRSRAPVTAQITGLRQLTTYHYRVVAFSPQGTTRGADRTFRTLRTPITFAIN